MGPTCRIETCKGSPLHGNLAPSKIIATEMFLVANNSRPDAKWLHKIGDLIFSQNGTF